MRRKKKKRGGASRDFVTNRLVGHLEGLRANQESVRSIKSKKKKDAVLTSPPLTYSMTKQRRSLVWKEYLRDCRMRDKEHATLAFFLGRGRGVKRYLGPRRRCDAHRQEWMPSVFEHPTFRERVSNFVLRQSSKAKMRAKHKEVRPKPVG